MEAVSTPKQQYMGSKSVVLQGYVLLFGGSEGAPMVPDGWCGPPGHRGGRLRPKNVSGDNFRVALPYTSHDEIG